jgi:CCR4-NOT transcription complex subunit 7/8
MGSFRNKSDYHYQTLRCNVDLLKIIQLGITLFSEDGKEIPPSPLEADINLPTQAQGSRRHGVLLPCTWQFNFKFSTKEDMYSEVSIESLRQAGLDFQNIEQNGIDPSAFAALLISSGLVCDPEVHWISFHGGYDFGYLTKILICQPLPDDEREFKTKMEKFFPSIYDIKFLMKFAIKQHSMGGNITPLDNATAEILAKFDQKSSLEGVSESFKVKRLGNAHTAGSDSLLTGRVFFRMREKIFNGDINKEHIGKVWGLGFPDNSNIHNPATQSTPQHQQLQAENTTPSQNGNTYSGGLPSTPKSILSTPAHVTNNNGNGPLTPGGGVMFGGGAFGQFLMNNK